MPILHCAIDGNKITLKGLAIRLVLSNYLRSAGISFIPASDRERL